MLAEHQVRKDNDHISCREGWAGRGHPLHAWDRFAVDILNSVTRVLHLSFVSFVTAALSLKTRAFFLLRWRTC